MVSKGNWDLLEWNWLSEVVRGCQRLSEIVRGCHHLDELLQTYCPTKTIVLRGIPTNITWQSLLAHIAANTHREEREDYVCEERNGAALVGLQAHCECCNIIVRLAMCVAVLS